ncbi:MAG: TolC family protein [Kofleriaceae bacterium]
MRCLALVVPLAGCVAPYRGAQPPVLGVPLEDREPAPPLALDGAAAGGEAPILVGLPELIRISVRVDPSLAAAREGIEQARADAVTAGLAPNPTLGISRTMVPFRSGESDPQLDIEVGYTLDALLFGKRRAAIEAARRAVDVAIADRDEAVRRRIGDAIAAYVEAVQARALVPLAREELAQLERVAAITERRVAAGGAGQIEAERIGLEVLASRRRLLVAEAELDNARTRFRAHLGRVRGAERAEPAGALDAIRAPRPPSLEAVLRAAEQHRPDLRGAHHRLALARAELEQQRVSARPALGVALIYTRVLDLDLWGAAIELSLPVSDRNQGNIARARSAMRQAAAQIEAARIELRSELAQAVRSYRAAYDVATTIDARAIEAAAGVRTRVEESYALGGRTLIEVLDAQATYRDAMREHVAARAALLRALHELDAAAGAVVLVEEARDAGR